jgi:hypothetical protein
MAKGASQPRRQRSFVWLQGLLCGAVATLATPTALLLGVLLAPALLAVAFDRDAGRPRARSIALFSMAASVGPLRTLWISGHTLSTALTLLTDVRVVGTAWCAAAVGWLLTEMMPFAVRALLDALSIARKTRLETERARLAEAWKFDGNPEPPGKPDEAV